MKYTSHPFLHIHECEGSDNYVAILYDYYPIYKQLKNFIGDFYIYYFISGPLADYTITLWEDSKYAESKYIPYENQVCVLISKCEMPVNTVLRFNTNTRAHASVMELERWLTTQNNRTPHVNEPFTWDAFFNEFIDTTTSDVIEFSA